MGHVEAICGIGEVRWFPFSLEKTTNILLDSHVGLFQKVHGHAFSEFACIPMWVC